MRMCSLCCKELEVGLRRRARRDGCVACDEWLDRDLALPYLSWGPRASERLA